MYVLVINDESVIREIVAEVIEEAGCGVVIVEHGQAALTHLQRCTELPCCIIIDLLMPIMNGTTFREQQLQDPRLAAIPTIVMSAAQYRPRGAEEVPFTDTIAAPPSLDTLLETIGRYCECPVADAP